MVVVVVVVVWGRLDFVGYAHVLGLGNMSWYSAQILICKMQRVDYFVL